MITLEPGKDLRSRSPETLNEDIARYYEQNYWDYRTAWYSANDLALHYGHWEEHTRTHSEALLNKNRLLADTGHIVDGETILDAGCGVGGSSLWLADRFDKARITGLTLSPTQAKVANQYAQKRGVADRVNFQVGDFGASGFADASFDVIWCCETICYMTDKGAFMREAMRLLKPGGRLVGADGFATRNQYAEDDWKPLQICLDGWEVPNLAMQDEFIGYMQQAGFIDIDFKDYTSHVMPSSRRMYLTAMFTYPMHLLMSWLGMRSPGQKGNFNVALNQYRLFRDNLTHYGVFCATKPR